LKISIISSIMARRSKSPFYATNNSKKMKKYELSC